MPSNTSSTTAANAAAEVSTAELQAQLAALKSDIAELTTTMTRYGKLQGEALRSQAYDGLRAVANKGAESMTAAQEYAGAKYSETEDYVRAHPATAVGIAAGIGFLVGLVTSRH